MAVSAALKIVFPSSRYSLHTATFDCYACLFWISSYSINFPWHLSFQVSKMMTLQFPAVSMEIYQSAISSRK
jgi:hypothetical protein